MPATLQETHFALYPVNPESLQHNTRVLSNIRAISSLLLGIAAGVLGLESLYGFAFYFIGQQLVSSLFWFLLVKSEGDAERFFVGDVVEGKGSRKLEGKRVGAWKDVWLGGGLFAEGLSGFVLGWAGVGGVIR